MGFLFRLLPWNWNCFRRFQPKSHTGRVLWNIWWGLSALPGPGPIFWLAAWIAYECGYEKEVTAIWNFCVFFVEKCWWLISTVASFAWMLIERMM